MFETLDIFKTAAGAAEHASRRQALIAQNIANADTPGYRGQDVAPFADMMADYDTPMRHTRVGHLQPTSMGAATETILSDGMTSPNGNTVSLETEMMKAAQTRGQFDMAMGVYKSALNILKSSLGR